MDDRIHGVLKKNDECWRFEGPYSALRILFKATNDADVRSILSFLLAKYLSSNGLILKQSVMPQWFPIYRVLCHNSRWHNRHVDWALKTSFFSLIVRQHAHYIQFCCSASMSCFKCFAGVWHFWHSFRGAQAHYFRLSVFCNGNESNKYIFCGWKVAVPPSIRSLCRHCLAFCGFVNNMNNKTWIQRNLESRETILCTYTHPNKHTRVWQCTT